MARMAFRASKEYELKLLQFQKSAPQVIIAAIYAGAKVIADAIKKALGELPTDQFRHLKEGEKFNGPTEHEKKDLIAAFGVTPIKRGKDNNFSAKIGFDGYGSIPTRKYPSGVPNQLVARSIESGSTVRKKTPFVRSTVTRAKKAAQEAMVKAADAEIEKIFKS